MTVEACGQKASTVFGVAPKLATKMILRTACIDKEISRIETNCGRIVLLSHTVVIIVCFVDEDAVKLA